MKFYQFGKITQLISHMQIILINYKSNQCSGEILRGKGECSFGMMLDECLVL